MDVKLTPSILTLVLLLGCQSGEPDVKLESGIAATAACLDALPTPVSLDGGAVTLGNNKAYPEERPERGAKIDAFSIDANEVTNAQFQNFVEATGYITEAETPQPGFDVAGGAVFSSPSGDNPSWWHFVEGANWRHPDGPSSSIDGRGSEPVVQVTLKDARAYADWAGRRLPTEMEWEYAAKAGSDALYIWGDERAPKGEEQANTWQGAFPIENTVADGFQTRAPVGCYAPNAFGLYDMIGNVWEWTETDWGNGQSHVIKGGSFLCAENYCRRYRAASRQPQESNFSTNHIGFRTARD